MKKHGETVTKNGKRAASPEYRTWQMMKNRCHNPKADNWELYGGRGIMVCDDWHDFNLFLEDMGRRPSLLYTLDRIDVDGHYCKQNCKWATKGQQSQNRRCLKLTQGEVDRIRSYKRKGMSTAELVKMFNVGERHIQRIVKRQRW